MMPERVYLVRGARGEYGDYTDWYIGVFFDRIKAEDFLTDIKNLQEKLASGDTTAPGFLSAVEEILYKKAFQEDWPDAYHDDYQKYDFWVGEIEVLG